MCLELFMCVLIIAVIYCFTMCNDDREPLMALNLSKVKYEMFAKRLYGLFSHQSSQMLCKKADRAYCNNPHPLG